MNSEVMLFERADGIYNEARKKIEENGSYNVFTILNMERYEVNTHSKMIYSLLDVNGSHNMGDQYLKLFIKSLGFEDWEKEENDWACKAEYISSDVLGSRPDFVIYSGKSCILVEMKIDAGDGEKQLSRYSVLLNQDSEFKCIEEHKKRICYLTLNGRPPSSQSADGVDVELLSFKEHILNWLDACIDITDESKDVYSGLQQYRNLIRKLVQEDSGLSEMVELMKSDGNYAAFQNIHNVYCQLMVAESELKKQTLVRFFRCLEDYLRPIGFQPLIGSYEDYTPSKCRFVNPCDFHFHKARGVGYYLTSDSEFKQRKSKSKYKKEVLITLTNEDCNTLCYGLMLWNETDQCYMTDYTELKYAFDQLGFLESGLFQYEDERICWGDFTSESDEWYNFEELTDPVIDMFTEVGLTRQIKRITETIQRIINLFDEDKKYQLSLPS